MEFSSPYATDIPLCKEKTEFYAVSPSGMIYHVEEKMVTDKRTSSGMRLKRTDKATGKSLIGQRLALMPDDYDPDNAQEWLMIKLLNVLDHVDTLSRDIEYLRSDVERLEEQHRNDYDDNVLYSY